jgi:cysteine desulfurase
MAAACCFALENAQKNLHERLEYVSDLKNYLLENLPKSIKLNSPPDASPFILNLSAPNIRGIAFQSALNARGIAVSVKSACSADNTPSRPVFAVSGNKKNALNSWRVSLSHHTTRREIDALIFAINEILELSGDNLTVPLQGE